MTNYREILRIHSRGISQRGIAASCQCSRNTIKKVLAQAKEMSIGWPLRDDLTDGDLEKLFFTDSAAPASRRLTYDRIVNNFYIIEIHCDGSEPSTREVYGI